LAFELQSHADLDLIRLVQATAACKVAIEDVSFPLRFLLKHKAEEVGVLNAKLTVPIRFAFKAITEADDREVISIVSRFEAVYDLAEGFEPTPEQMAAFKDGNAVFNCWTYFREFVHSTVSRMNYPPPTLPFLRMVPRAISKDSPLVPRALEAAAPTEQGGGDPRRGRKPSKEEEKGRSN
jgi:hypothetical protein